MNWLASLMDLRIVSARDWAKLEADAAEAGMEVADLTSRLRNAESRRVAAELELAALEERLAQRGILPSDVADTQTGELFGDE